MPPAPTIPDGLTPGGRVDEWAGAPVGWIASDVDGTILGSDDEVVSSACDALVAAAERVAVGLVTGRMRNGLARIHDRAPVPGPHVLFNGAEVRMAEATVASWPLADDEVAGLLDLCREHGAYAEFYSLEEYWITRTDARAEAHWASLGQLPVGLVAPSAPPPDPIVKATLIGFGEDETTRLHDALEAAGLAVGDGRSLAHPDWSYLNATRHGVDKANALRAGAAHLGIDMASVLMIGDGHNDMPALDVAGTAIAMGNAGDHVKARAHLVTEHVDRDGLAVALRALDLA